MSDLIELVSKLCSLSGVSGDEDSVRGYIAAHVEASLIKTDTMGNLMFFKEGKNPSRKPVMFCAHMDEVGLQVRRINDDGSLKFQCVGGIDRRVLLGRRVLVGKNKVPGVIGLKAFHLLKDGGEKTLPSLDELNIDIGCFSEKEAEKQIQIGDYCSFPPNSQAFGDGLFSSKAIDDRAGCAVLMRLMRRRAPVDTWFVFTVQEEVGARGAYITSFSIQPETAVILEATTAADLPDISEDRQVCKLGGGVVIPHMDKSAIYDLAPKLQALAAELNIPWQTKTVIAGGTDAGSVQRGGNGVPVGSLAVPTRYLHSPSGVCSVSDLENMEKLAAAYYDSLG